MPKHIPEIAVLIDTSSGHGRGVLRGIIQYQNEHGPWSIMFRPTPQSEPPPGWLARWRGDGILARIPNAKFAVAIRKTHAPVVDLPYDTGGHGFPSLFTHNPLIVKLAARHLLDLGLRNFGFCGWPRGVNSRMDERCDLFVQAIRDAGHPCDVYQARRGMRQGLSWEQHQRQIAAWLRKLPKPVGVMACYDEQGQHVLAACQSAGISVPDEVAVIGSNNDELLCALTNPSLTSIDPGFERIGYEAAALLDRLMAGHTPPDQTLNISPVRLIPRGSTDMLAIDDQELALALRYIRDNACRGISVGDVLRDSSLSRSLLERRMKAVTGRTPKAEIIRVQLENAKRLLSETDLSLALVAERTGFQYPQHFSELFKRKFGQTPSDFRRGGRFVENPETEYAK